MRLVEESFSLHSILKYLAELTNTAVLDRVGASQLVNSEPFENIKGGRAEDARAVHDDSCPID